MKVITKLGIEYKKDTSWSDKLYDAIWTDGKNKVVVGGNSWNDGSGRETNGWEVSVNGKKLTMNDYKDGRKTRTSNSNAFTKAKEVITKFIKEEKATIQLQKLKGAL